MPVLKKGIYMSAAKEKIVKILRQREDSLSDGYGYYADNVQEALLNIADEIIAALDTKVAANSALHNSESAPCCPRLTRCNDGVWRCGILLS
jgi:hypothetical protein